MKKNDFFLKTFTITIILSLLGCITGITYAWFSQANKVELDTIYKGTSAGAYFAYGDGSKDSPFGINEPRHLYNLAWLQYLGQFNNDTDGDNKIDSQYYFELDSDIDMNNLVLPPIGTEENPFIGNFNGKEYTISNLIISNSIDSDNITNYPYIVNSSEFNNDKLEVIGFFGVVGYLPDDETKYSLSSITETSGTDTTETPVNQVQNLYLNNITVKNTSSQLLAGFLAGYVNGSMTDCGVHYCNFDIASGTTNISNLSTSVSKYSYVGAINTNKYKIDGDTSGGGQDNDWGGSIDMRTLNRRIEYILAKSATILGYNAISTDSSYGLYARGPRTEYDWDSQTLAYYQPVYLADGTILPINVDMEEMSLSSLDVTSGNSQEIDSSITDNKNKLNQSYKEKSSEIVGSKNVGYIVGGGSTSATSTESGGYIRSRIQALATGSTNESGIYKSQGLTSKGSIQVYDKNKFVMLTMDVDGNTYIISDEINNNNETAIIDTFNSTSTTLNYDSEKLGFENDGKLYLNARKNFDETMNGSYTVHGFHFMNKVSENLGAGTSRNTTSATVQLYSLDNKQLKTYQNYELIRGGLNFTLSEAGVIKTIVGVFYQNESNSLFDLYHITRQSSSSGTSSKTTITDIERITKIYRNTSSKEIAYNSKPNENGWKLVFDFEKTSKDCLENGAAYYFEMPVTAGDYVIGADTSSSSNGSYLMYLDIGANASSETGEDEKNTLSIDFVWATSDSSEAISLIKITDTAYVKSEVVLEITVSSETSAKRSYFYYKRIAPVSSGTSSTFSYVYYYGDCGGLAISNVGTEGNAILKTSKDEVVNA